MLKTKVFLLAIALLSFPVEGHSSTKGCVSVFADGAEECSVVLYGAICDSPRNGSTIRINGKKVIKRYQVRRCPGVDGLGRPKRSNRRYSENSYQQSECSCRTARGQIIDCLKVQIDPNGCNELCKSRGASFGVIGCD